jgi:trk system potassium uptake protein TrkH
MIAVVSLILEHGRYLSKERIVALQTLDVAIIGLFVLEMVGKLLIARERLHYLRQHVVYYGLLGMLLLWLLLAHELASYPAIEEFLNRLNIVSVTKLYIVIIQIAIIARLMVEVVEAQRRLAHARFSPARILVAGFLFIILIGAVLLYSPRATPPTHRVSFMDSLFTATSATCVTGLTVRDTGTGFTPFGQVVILVLIQVGGVGLMTFASFFAMALGMGMGVKDRMLMQDVLKENAVGEIGRLIVYILGLTFLIEALGAVILYPAWNGTLTFEQRLYTSVFHSVSCFCNAGFSLYSTNLEGYCASIHVNVTASMLIILGGLGFAVHRNVIEVTRGGFRKLPLPFCRRRLLEPSNRPRPSLHTKVVLTVTVMLVVGGALVFYLLEREGVLAGKSLRERVLASTFQSVTSRTAGFNTVAISELSNASLVFIAILMFIGASPGSTGGGIKTVTLAMLLIGAAAVVRNRANFEAFHRTIPHRLVNQAAVVVTVAACVVATATILLCYFERDTMIASDGVSRPVMLRETFFEVFSAFGTVGLSTGITPVLTSAGKVIIMLTMLVGRVGPLTLVLALSQRLPRTDYDYPAEHVMIG